jgi:NADPH-dependent 2,4-dienoyl-CoA reductase/sulfur reductase-like enzyme
MDHHTLMTGSRVGNRLFLKLVREMGGSGTLPDEPARKRVTETVKATATATHAGPDVNVDLCIVGGGPGGLAAARAFAEASPGTTVALFDEQGTPGGSLLAEPGGSQRAAEMASAARRAGARLEAEATAIAYFPEDRRGVLAVVTATGLLRVRARRYLYATGAYDQNLPFADNDRPGVLSARACGRLAFHFGVRPVPAGQSLLVLAASGCQELTAQARALTEALSAAGVAATMTEVGRGQRALGARGTQTVRGLEISRDDEGDHSAQHAGDPAGKTHTIRAALVAVAALPAPASELARQHGAEVTFDPSQGGFSVMIDDRFQTRADAVHACGDVTGFAGSAAAALSGAAAGRAIAAALRGDSRT